MAESSTRVNDLVSAVVTLLFNIIETEENIMNFVFYIIIYMYHRKMFIQHKSYI